jgi:hypothetical protein
LTNITLDDVALSKNGETLGLEKKRSSKRKKNKSLKRLGLVDGDALTLTYSSTNDALTAGDVSLSRHTTHMVCVMASTYLCTCVVCVVSCVRPNA